MRIILLGNSGLADEVEDLANELGHEIVGRLTTETIDMIYAIPHEGMVLAVGSPTTKELFLNRLTRYYCKWTSLISPHARISPRAKIQNGCVIQHGTVITANAIIKANTYVNLNVTIGHGTVIGENCTINPGANISGNVTIGWNVLVGTGAQILEKLNINDNAIIGAGAVVTHNVPSNVIAKGVPAKW